MKEQAFVCGSMMAILLLGMVTDASHKIKSKTGLSQQGKQNIMLHEAVRTLLGFKESLVPQTRSDLLPFPGQKSDDEKPPQYMLDLYEKFKNSRISKGQLSGNTVRSIHAEIGEYLFTLSFLGQYSQFEVKT
jgi:hypothetical protein